MVNDITTLNGSLRELGETMAANLTAQGVPSTYDEGLTTLAGKILDIQGGGSTRTLTLTSDKDILSYVDSESATLTATLLEDGVGVSGATVEFFNGSTSLGTAQTDSNGVAVKTYTSTGAGDVSLKAEADNGMIVTETYGVQDCIYYHDMTSADSTHWTIPASANASYSSSGMKIQGSSWTDCYLEIPTQKPCSIEFDVTDYTYSSGNPPILVYLYSNNKDRLFNMSYSTDGYFIFDVQGSSSNHVNYTLKKPMNFRIEVNSNELKLYIDDTLKISKSYDMSSPLLFGPSTATNRSTTYKNIKVKPL